VLMRPLLAWPYLLRAAAALVLPGHPARRYWLHARQALFPGRGEGIREAAETYNRALGSGA
jgi:N-acetylglucosaminyl-diphospho-decaprenol L-rhamnosyltransferase